MSYFEELRQPSFRGIEFEAFVASDGGGRRGKVNQFPKSVDAQFNDRGGKTKPFILNASVFGTDAITQADALEDALNKEGPGRLVHPTRGEMLAVCTDFTRKSSWDQGERVTFTIEFFRQPERTAGVKVSQNPQKAAQAQELQTDQDSINIFSESYNIANEPAFLFESAKADFLKMTAEMTAFLGDTASEVAEFTNELDSLLDEPAELIAKTQALIGATVRAASFENFGLRTRTSGASNAFSNSRVLQNFSTDFESIPVTTSTREIQQKNSEAIQLAVRTGATVVEAQLHRGDEGETLFNTRQEAQAALQTLLRSMQLRKNESSELSPSMARLMATTATASSAKYGILADEKTIEIQVDTDSVLLAYELYDDYLREEEIRVRNNLTDTFIKKGSILQVAEQ